MKAVLSDPKTGKSYQLELEESKKAYFIEKRMGESIDGKIIGADDYMFEITGGSDKSGFPMRKDIYGGRKIRVYLKGGVGFKPERKGGRKKKMVRGNTVSEDIIQVNLKVTKHGAKALEELFGKKTEKKE